MHIVEKEFKEFVESYKDINDFYVAYSGGVDSQVLLYLSNKYIKSNTIALHVNHGISSNAKEWENFCSNTSKKYNISIKTANFQLKEEKSNLEEKARELRYGFFEENVKENSALMTGHHLDDQAETFMLRLMRGAGVDGLSSMQPERSFNGGKLIRPLLNVSKEEIIDFANSVNLKWVEDESNKDVHYDRNFIRNEVMPLLRTRWNHANKAIARSATHCQKAKKQSDIISAENLESVSINENEIDSIKLMKFNNEEQKNVIRAWLKSKNLKMPDEKALNVLISEVVTSRKDSKACFTGKDYEIKKSFNTIYFVKKNQDIIFKINEDSCQVSMTKTNEKMLYKGKVKKLKVILKEEKIPEWERDFYPVYKIKDVVVAVGNIYSDGVEHLFVNKIYN